MHCDSASEMMAEALKWVPPKQALEPAADCTVVDSAPGSERAAGDEVDASGSSRASLESPGFTALPSSPVRSSAGGSARVSLRACMFYACICCRQ